MEKEINLLTRRYDRAMGTDDDDYNTFIKRLERYQQFVVKNPSLIDICRELRKKGKRDRVSNHLWSDWFDILLATGSEIHSSEAAKFFRKLAGPQAVKDLKKRLENVNDYFVEELESFLPQVVIHNSTEVALVFDGTNLFVKGDYSKRRRLRTGLPKKILSSLASKKSVRVDEIEGFSLDAYKSFLKAISKDFDLSSRQVGEVIAKKGRFITRGEKLEIQGL